MLTNEYERRLVLPIEGDSTTAFISRTGVPLAVGYKRIVIGGRGPYIEFEPCHIQQDLFKIPKAEEWRVDSPAAYYIEFRSTDGNNIKLYFQKRRVQYADYVPGLIYISPVDLFTKFGDRVLRRK